MQPDYMNLKNSPSFKHTPDPTFSRHDSTGSDVPRYTSLKDIMLSMSPQYGSTGSLLDSSNISIRNELLKHAASAYLQSVAIPANRDQDWVNELWEKLKTRCVGFYSCWEIHVWAPLQDVCVPVVRIFHGIFRRIRDVVRERVEMS